MIGKIIVGVAIFVVLAILIAGVTTLTVDSPRARAWSNRLMRYRVLAQFIAILLILAVLYFTSAH